MADPVPASRAILSNVLLDCGLRVHEAATTGALRSILYAHPEVRLVLVDWNVPPDGGFGLVRELRCDARLAGRRVIAILTDPRGQDLAAALEAGIDDYLTRPFTPSTIREKLDVLGVMAA
ncbi:MAG: response regulator [Phycisphaerae bacterium]|nr:response regulator [Phycisphaerae bacterium]